MLVVDTLCSNLCFDHTSEKFFLLARIFLNLFFLILFQALEHYSSASLKDHPASLFNSAMIHLQRPLEAGKNQAIAIKLLERAAELGLKEVILFLLLLFPSKSLAVCSLEWIQFQWSSLRGMIFARCNTIFTSVLESFVVLPIDVHLLSFLPELNSDCVKVEKLTPLHCSLTNTCSKTSINSIVISYDSTESIITHPRVLSMSYFRPSES